MTHPGQSMATTDAPVSLMFFSLRWNKWGVFPIKACVGVSNVFCVYDVSMLIIS